MTGAFHGFRFGGQAFLHKQRDLVAFVLVFRRGGAHRLRFRKTLGFQQPQALNAPVQNPAQISRFSEQLLELPVLFPFLKMPLEGNRP